MLDDRCDPPIPNPEVLRTLRPLLWVQVCGVGMPWIDHLQILQTLAIYRIPTTKLNVSENGGFVKTLIEKRYAVG